MEETRKARAAEQARVQAEATSRARQIYNNKGNIPHGRHVYLAAKGVQPVAGLKMGGRDNNLIVPLYDDTSKIISLQFISEDGNKRFLTGGRKKGCFFPIGKDADKPLVICEGLATGLSLYEGVGLPVLVAFDAGNLLPVAEVARRCYPDRKIVICADNDIKEDGSANVGADSARAAAMAVDGFLAVPRHEGRKCDWNDIHVKMGAAEVCLQFQTHSKPTEPAPTNKDGDKEKLPSGFSLRSGGPLPGLWHTELKEDSDPVETWVGASLHVLGLTRDETSNAWGLLLEWYDQDGIRHTWAMPLSLLQGRDPSALLSRLADGGWRGSAGNKAKQLLTLYLASYNTDRRVRCVHCTGWHHNAFVFPDEVITNAAGHAGRAGQSNGDNVSMPSSNEAGLLDMLDNEQIVLQVQTPHNPFRMAGTLGGWQASIGAWSRGNSRLMLAVCASLAAPLLEITNLDSGGFNWMGQSSTGKTTVLVAAGSVWGKGASSGGYVGSWRATPNGLEGIAAQHSDAALCLDEIGQAPGRTIMEASYMLANGMGKTRANQDGSARAAKSWRCMVLSTGEKGLAEKIAEEGGRVQAGQLVRLIDVPANAGAGMGIFENLHGHGSPRAFADIIKQAAATHYGHAARAFIGKIQEDREGIKNALHVALGNAGKLLCPDGASGQVERVARRFALCAAAGEMSADWGLLSWGKGEALKAVKVCFDAWLSLRGGAGAAEDAAMLEQVTLFIEQHGASRFQDIDNPTATCINRVGFRRKTDTVTEFYILPESFKAEVCKGHS